MKYLVTVVACFVVVSVSAQTPYNPDSDSDNLIGFDDLLDFLPLYGSEIFPEINQPAFQTCVTQPTDTCFVNEDTDVVLVQFNIADGRIALPNDSSFKKIVIISDTWFGGYADIAAKTHPNYEWSDLYQGFDEDDAAIFVRTPSGFWRKVQE